MNRSPDVVRELRQTYLFADMSEPHLQKLIQDMLDVHLKTSGGLIEVQGNHITVRDVQALRNLVHMPPEQ